MVRVSGTTQSTIDLTFDDEGAVLFDRHEHRRNLAPGLVNQPETLLPITGSTFEILSLTEIHQVSNQVKYLKMLFVLK